MFISVKLARSSLLALAKSIYYSSWNILFQVFFHHVLHFLLKMYRLFSVFWTVNIYILLDGLVCSIVDSRKASQNTRDTQIQTTQIPLELIKHFVKRPGIGDPLNAIDLSVSWWPVPDVVSVALQGFIFQKFAWETEMEWQVIVRLMIVFQLRKTDCKYKNYAEKIAGMKDENSPTNSRSFKELRVLKDLKTHLRHMILTKWERLKSTMSSFLTF